MDIKQLLESFEDDLKKLLNEHKIEQLFYMGILNDGITCFSSSNMNPKAVAAFLVHAFKDDVKNNNPNGFMFHVIIHLFEMLASSGMLGSILMYISEISDNFDVININPDENKKEYS